MSTQTIPKTAGATSKHCDISLYQKASATSPGDPITGLAFNTGSLTAYYRIGTTGTLTAITLATQTVGGAYSSGGFVEIDATHAPGGYRFDIPDAVIATAGESNIWFTGAANMATHQLKIIVQGIDVYATMAANNAANAMVESYAADGAAPTQAQALFQILSYLYERNWSGATLTCKKLDGSTTAMTITANAAAGAVSMSRTA